MALVWALAFADAFCKSSSPTDTSIEVVDDVVDEVVEDSLETLELDELLEAEAEELVPAGSDEEEEAPAPQEASNDPNAKTNKAFETFICESPFVATSPGLNARQNSRLVFAGMKTKNRRVSIQEQS